MSVWCGLAGKVYLGPSEEMCYEFDLSNLYFSFIRNGNVPFVIRFITSMVGICSTLSYALSPERFIDPIVFYKTDSNESTQRPADWDELLHLAR